MNSRRRLGVAAGVALMAGGLACGGGSDGGPPSSGRKTVLVANNEFQPATVNITAGDTILWAWAANGAGHNIIPTGANTFLKKGNDVPAGTGSLGTDFFNAPTSHQVVFPVAATYTYYCSQHNLTMTGTVVVAP
jgi:plastocyanin